MIHRLSVAPMMDWTDRHDRFFLRQITRHTRLYTEMVTSSALLHGNADRLLGFSPEEHPLALQLGGSDPSEMAKAAEIAVPYNFDEININVGCPSDRVQSGRFGACLMEDPEQVARLVESISRRVEVPVTVKHRIGIDDLDSYAHLFHFVETVSNAGCSVFIIHARKAWLKGLSPKENRSVPPLRYDVVYQIKRDFPHLKVVLNGGVTSLDQVEDHLRHVDGVMVGREAYQNPYMLAHADSVVFGDASPVRTRREIVEAMLPYIEKCSRDGVYLSRITRHMLGLFQGKPGARAWKRHLSERAHLEGANVQDVRDALSRLPVSVLDEAM
ncbi:MAG: tRNA dihydrouridine(20/20a) synthase DusA [Deinococcaceae bacterium]